MAFCRNCGQQMDDGATFCPRCGTATNENAQQPQQVQQAQQAPVQPQVMNPDQPLPGEKGLAWLAYVLWTPLFLIPMFVKKSSAYCQYHVKQGATLWATHIVYWIVTSILTAFFDAVSGGYSIYGVRVHGSLYWVVSLLFSVGTIFLAVLAIIGIVNAATGKMKELPLIGKIPFIAALIDKIYASLNK